MLRSLQASPLEPDVQGACGVIDFTATKLLPVYQARRHLWLRRGDKLVCPNGHHLKHNAALLEHEAFICQFRDARGSGECGARCYVLAMPGGRIWVAEVTPAEMLAMRDRHLDADGVLRFLSAG